MFCRLEETFYLCNHTNKHKQFLRKMQLVKSVRATVIDIEVGGSHEFGKGETTERYVSHLCSILKKERGWIYSVSQPIGSEVILVTRYE